MVKYPLANIINMIADTIAPLKQMEAMQPDVDNDMFTVLIPVCLLMVVVLLAIAGFAYYIKRRRQGTKYKSKRKS